MAKLGCAASLFQCFASSKKKKRKKNRAAAAHNESRGIGEDESLGRTNATDHDQAKLQQSCASFDRAKSPYSQKSSCGSVASARSSVYLDALDVDSDFDIDDTFESIQIDGQFFFSARDDVSISQEVFEGIKMYPAVPTTEPDPTSKYPVSSSNLQSWLHTYQHTYNEADEEKEMKATDMVGESMAHQANRLMKIKKEQEPESVFESTNLLLEELKVPKVKVRERGYPGELTENELESVKAFQKQLMIRDPIYNDIVRCLSSVEKEAYALCRFLRARKFDVEKVFELLDEAKDGFRIAKQNDFYPDIEKVLGVSSSVFLSQYPSIFSGNARNGCPVMYLGVGKIQPEGVKCLVSLKDVDRWFWHDFLYTLCPLIDEGIRINPNLVRCEAVNIYDLKGISKAQITSDTFEVVKVGNKVMTSFPETLHCLLIINAPSWFGLVWSVGKRLIDPRTASKIEVFTSAKDGLARMNELIDPSQIPEDYGGYGPALASASQRKSVALSVGGGPRNAIVLNCLMQLSKKNLERTHQFILGEGERCTVMLYTRCTAGANALLYKGDSDSEPILETRFVGEMAEEPYSRTIGTCAGPGSFSLQLSGSAPGFFLVLGIII